jgi:SAM-dependent methyltransferase
MRTGQEVDAAVAWLDEQIGLPKRATILDIGCGPGMYSNRLAARGYRVTGIDIAQPFLEHARAEAQAQGLDCTYQNLSMFEMAFEAEFAAVLLLQSIVGRMTTDETLQLMTDIRRALRSAGHCICEFQVRSARFASAEPAVTESLMLLGQSPWSDRPHAWLVRDLFFPASSERVDHHLVLRSDGPPLECWPRFQLYSVPAIAELLAAAGMRVRAVFGRIPGQQLRPEDSTCVIWAQAMA